MGFDRWRKIGRRLAQMDRAELRDRARQEFDRWQDSALAQVGFDFTKNSRRVPSGPAGNFFFTPEAIDSRLTFLRQRMPGEVERITLQAEKICRRKYDLLGYTDLDFGSPVDWHLDAVHGKRAPRKLFHRVRYLDFAEVGDSKITWELNRHQHLVTLAKAYRLSGDLRYADEILYQWRDWRAENPYPRGINWASSLEVAFRSLSWIWTYHLLAGAPGLPEIRDEWLRSLVLHGRHIERYLSTYFSPNTHLLGEGVALFFLGICCPELKVAGRWRSLGWNIILQESERQVRSDGFHFEQSTHYHVYALDFFLHAAVLAGQNDIPIPKKFEATLEKMLNALCLLGRGGVVPSFGDDDGGRVFDARRNRRQDLLDPLSTGAILFHRGDFKAIAGDLREETVWLLGTEGAKQWDELEAVHPGWHSSALEESGFYLLAAETTPTQVVVDVGPLGTGSGGHGHADALSFNVASGGKAALLDPGTYQYVAEGGDRDWFRGTAMHNTLRVDGVSQADPATPFSWKQLTRSKVEQWIQGKSFDLLVASHDGYQRLPQSAVHRRQVVNLKNGIYLVRDVVEGQGRHRLDISLHLPQEFQLVAEGLFRIKSGSQGLALLPVEDHGWAQQTRKDLWSPVYGQKAPMTVLNFELTSDLPAEFAFLLVTLDQVEARPGLFRRFAGPKHSTAQGYRYEFGDAMTGFFFGEEGRPWRLDRLSSDAEFACWRQNGNAIQSLSLCNGTFAVVEGGLGVRCRRKVAWSEIILAGGERTLYSSDLAAIEEDAVPSDEPPGAASPTFINES